MRCFRGPFARTFATAASGRGCSPGFPTCACAARARWRRGWPRPARPPDEAGSLSREHHVAGPRRVDVLGAGVTKRQQIEPAEQVLAAPQQHWTDGEVHLVDEALLEILADGRDASAEPHVAAASCCPRSIEGGVDAVGDEVEGGAAL